MPGASKPLQLHIFDDQVIVERVADKSCLCIKKAEEVNGLTKLDIKMDVSGRMIQEIEGGQDIYFDAIFGIYHLVSGPFLAFVLQSSASVKLQHIELRKVNKVVIIPLFRTDRELSIDQQQDEDKYLELLHESLSTHHFYFSHYYDVTHSLQRVTQIQSDPETQSQPLWQRADDRFFWNKNVISDLVKAEAHQFIIPMMNAHVEFRINQRIGDDRFHILFVSRRSRYRQGCRFTMRGIDEEGHVGNFVETEQALLYENGKQSSFVQIRGSIPSLWSQPVTMKYTPKVKMGPFKKSFDLYSKHMKECLDIYGHEVGTIQVNLIDKKKDQKDLGVRYAELSQKLNKSNVRYVWFDFHHECKKMKYQNLGKLLKEIEEDFEKIGHFSRDDNGKVVGIQKGVVRTNCMDNLDRTNVVQSIFARHSILLQLGLTPSSKGNVLESPYKDFEKTFKDIWGNNADMMSLYYSGTGALKTDFTRTGKRSYKGAINDGINSVMRYYLNNLKDGSKQDSIDILLGRYFIDPLAPSPFLDPPTYLEQETLASFLTKYFVLNIFFFVLFLVIFGDERDLSKLLLRSVAITFLVFVFMFITLLKKGGALGKKVVSKPLLVPESALYDN